MKMPGDIIKALKLIPEKEVDGMFEQLLTEKALQIEGREGYENLIALKAEVRALREIKQFFSDSRKR